MYGTAAHGVRAYTWPLASAPNDLPVVQITSPLQDEVVGSGGPNLRLTWSWTQIQGDTQSEYRITVTKGSNTTTTGWIQSPLHLGVIDVISNDTFPPDSPDMEVKLEAASLHRGYYDISTVLIDFAYGQPSVRWVVPDPLQILWSSDHITAQWEYFDSKAKAQQSYRVRLMRSGTVLHDSGWIQGAGTQYPVPFLLQDGSRYQLGVRVSNTNGVESVSA